MEIKVKEFLNKPVFLKKDLNKHPGNMLQENILKENNVKE